MQQNIDDKHLPKHQWSFFTRSHFSPEVKSGLIAGHPVIVVEFLQHPRLFLLTCVNTRIYAFVGDGCGAG